MTAEKNWHRQIDLRSLELHKLVAKKIRRNPSLINIVRENISRWLKKRSQPQATKEWLQILNNESLETVLKIISSDTEEAARLRQSTPFVGILTDKERMSIFKKFALDKENRTNL